MTSRRAFLSGLLASGLVPGASWAQAGAPAYLSAARLPSGDYALFGLDCAGALRFQVPLPGRGHASAAHPTQPLAVAFARRPGTFAIVLNCANGQVAQELQVPSGHHFSGHGTFSADGMYLFTSENDFDKGQGAIGVWHVQRAFQRVATLPSGGGGRMRSA